MMWATLAISTGVISAACRNMVAQPKENEELSVHILRHMLCRLLIYAHSHTQTESPSAERDLRALIFFHELTGADGTYAL
jgi:hypothetical protein